MCMVMYFAFVSKGSVEWQILLDHIKNQVWPRGLWGTFRRANLRAMNINYDISWTWLEHQQQNVVFQQKSQATIKSYCGEK